MKKKNVDLLRKALAVNPNSPHSPQTYFNIGTALQAQGDLQGAIDAYRQALAIQPDYVEALINLGVALRGQGNLPGAIDAYRQALTVNPNSPYSPQAYFNIGVALRSQGNLPGAIDAYRQALAIEPNYTKALTNLGAALRSQGNLPGAIDAYRQALAVNPSSPQTYFNLGAALQDQGDLPAAIDAYRQALAIEPNYAEALTNLGVALWVQGDLPGAVDAYRQALAVNPDSPHSPQAYFNLGTAFQAQGDLQGAIDAYRQALAIEPNYMEALTNLGVVLRDQGHLQAAIDAYRQALVTQPNCTEALTNLGTALQDQGHLQAAIDAYRQALAVNPDYPEAKLSLSLIQLLIGDYGSGWQGYECRLLTSNHKVLTARPQAERWDGRNLASGEPLILVAEQGLGDTLQFMRYVLYLNNTGKNASLCAPTKLHGLIQSSGVTTTIYSPEEGNQLTQGKWLPLLSLLQYLNVSPANPLVDTPYIKAPQQQVEYWQQKLAAEKRPIIGINWQGSQAGQKLGKSLPLTAFAPMIEKTDASLLSLQKGDGAEQMEDCSFRHRFVACQEEINGTWDFVETAAMIANCDLVITCDTSVAHLAAGMGKPTWLLLVAVPDWRWGMEGDTSFWYPSMRLFRQRERGNWQEVVDRVATALEAVATPRNETPGPGGRSHPSTFLSLSQN